MGNWDIISRNCWFDEIKRLYGEDFPYEFRVLVAQFLQKHETVTNVDANNEKNHPVIFQYVTLLKDEINVRLNEMRNREDFGLVYEKWTTLCQQNPHVQSLLPHRLFAVIKQSMNAERQMFNKLNFNGGLVPHSVHPLSLTATSNIQTLENLDTSLENLERQISEISYTLQHLTENGQFDILREIQALNKRIENYITLLTNVHGRVFSELDFYIDEQRHVAIGKHPASNLDKLENWLGHLVGFVDKLEQVCLHNFFQLCSQSHIYYQQSLNFKESTEAKILELRKRMKRPYVVFEHHTEQLLRTKVNIEGARLRVLSFSYGNISLRDIHADFVYISDANARLVSQPNYDHNQLPPPAFLIEPNKKNAKTKDKVFHQNTAKITLVAKSIVIQLPKGLLQQPTRDNPKGHYTNEQYWLYVRVKIGNNTKWFTTLSLPMWVCSNTAQFHKPATQQIWFNAFPAEARIDNGLHVPDQISWTNLVETIDYQFASLGRSLSVEEKEYLRQTIFRGQPPEDNIVTKAHFCQPGFCHLFPENENSKETENLKKNGSSKKKNKNSNKNKPNLKSLSFGEWLYFCLRILNWKPSNANSAIKPIRQFWTEGKIVAFMSGEKIESILKSKETPEKTFMLRFPQAWANCIGIYYYNAKKGATWKLLFTAQDFQITCLENLIIENNDLVHLYSNYEHNGSISKKEDVFTKIETPLYDIGLNYFRRKFREVFSRKSSKTQSEDEESEDSMESGAAAAALAEPSESSLILPSLSPSLQFPDYDIEMDPINIDTEDYVFDSDISQL